MSQAKKGNTVKVNYTGKFEDGIVFDTTSLTGEAMEFTIGANHVVPGFEKAVTGMKPGEKKTVHLKAKEAYGEYLAEKVTVVERGKLPPHITPEVGVPLQINLPSSSAIFVMVKKVTDTHVTLDANHPLAGKNLTFDIELVEIVQ